jgi:sterol desaturase/sphingolipid hydroxylase (fatty acid hydroxylase superfamily)
MRHHFQDDTRGYGIAAPYWDYVFRTKVDRDKRAAPAAPED